MESNDGTYINCSAWTSDERGTTYTGEDLDWTNNAHFLSCAWDPCTEDTDQTITYE